MAVIRRTCTVCGIVTRCDETDADFIACAHKQGPFEAVNEEEEAAAAAEPVPPVEE